MKGEIERWSEILKVLGERTRIRILCHILSNPGTPSEISSELGMDISLVSHHLRVLRHLGIVDYRKEGKKHIYFVKDEYVKKLIRFCMLEGETH